MKKREFTAVYKKTGRFISAWIEEIPGVNTQGRTKKEAKDNLREALLLVLETS
ncbi:MAG: type II toxin-antitoxin system HicB family antitoxin [bacterium]|nr:type II toxin-antitoxin system HicB family antitoxin [bacterium]